jgi:hypothetical protein
MTENVASPRRGFQFRLRTLMIGVTLFCVVIGGYVGWQAKIVRDRLVELDRHSYVTMVETDAPPECRVVSLIRRLLGDEHVWTIYVETGTDATEIERLHHLFPEAEIEFSTREVLTARYY